MVDAHDERGGFFVLGGRGQNDLLRAADKVCGGLFGGGVNAGRLDDVLNAVVSPLDLRSVSLAEDVDLVTVQDQILAVVLDRAVELAEHGVVLNEIDHVVKVCLAQINAADIKLLGMLGHDAQYDATDATETVDAHFDSHNDNPPRKCVRIFRSFAPLCMFIIAWRIFLSAPFLKKGDRTSLYKYVHNIQKHGKVFVYLLQIFHTFQTFEACSCA